MSRDILIVRVVFTDFTRLEVNTIIFIRHINYPCCVLCVVWDPGPGSGHLVETWCYMRKYISHPDNVIMASFVLSTVNDHDYQKFLMQKFLCLSFNYGILLLASLAFYASMVFNSNCMQYICLSLVEKCSKNSYGMSVWALFIAAASNLLKVTVLHTATTTHEDTMMENQHHGMLI